MAMSDSAVDGQRHGQSLVHAHLPQITEPLHHSGQAGVGLSRGAEGERQATGALQTPPPLADEGARVAVAVAPVHVLHDLHQRLVGQHRVD